jgi:hypothetical protein
MKTLATLVALAAYIAITDGRLEHFAICILGVVVTLLRTA